ncbi:hypothetical protein BDW22DRAFT_1345112 [Trametopsis cervina]|nr:hypothetical protein BDW22DRAFT_1345112 [Trametopsis cervina]
MLRREATHAHFLINTRSANPSSTFWRYRDDAPPSKTQKMDGDIHLSAWGTGNAPVAVVVAGEVAPVCGAADEEWLVDFVKQGTASAASVPPRHRLSPHSPLTSLMHLDAYALPLLSINVPSTLAALASHLPHASRRRPHGPLPTAIPPKRAQARAARAGPQAQTQQTAASSPTSIGGSSKRRDARQRRTGTGGTQPLAPFPALLRPPLRTMLAREATSCSGIVYLLPSTIQQLAAHSLNPLGRASLQRTASSSSTFSDVSSPSSSSSSTPTLSPTRLSTGFEDLFAASDSDDENDVPYAVLPRAGGRRPTSLPLPLSGMSARAASYSAAESEFVPFFRRRG